MQRLQLWFLRQGSTVLVHSYQEDRKLGKKNNKHVFIYNIETEIRS